MIASRTTLFCRLFLIIPILTIGFWLFAQKGCSLTPQASPTRASETETSQPSKPKSQSLQRASTLLRQAADLVDKDDPLAVKLIRQAIAILKQEVMPGIIASDLERVSMPLALGGSEFIGQHPYAGCITLSILSCKDSDIIPRLMIRNVEGPRALSSFVDE